MTILENSALIGGAMVSAFAAQSAQSKTIVTATVPICVQHFKKSDSSRGWNQGCGNNLGLIVEVKKPVYQWENTTINAGIIGGYYKNSIYRDSFLGGGVIEWDKRLKNGFSLQAGSPIGFVTGYNGSKIRPAIAPYAGVSAEIAQGFSLHTRGAWLPAGTITRIFPGMHSHNTDAITFSVGATFRFEPRR